MPIVETIGTRFKQLFNEQPVIVRSPGRANLIGEHTDYNMGFVLPCAIDKAVYFGISARSDKYCKIYALDKEQSYECSVETPTSSNKGWPNYLMGVVDQFNKAGYILHGFNCVFGGNIPIGAGLSSSAALESGLAFALNHIFDLGIDKLTLVKLGQRAENEFVGVQCGIMDQFVNMFGQSGTVLRLDCRSLEYEYFPFDDTNAAIVLFNSNVSHSLASTEYNQRRNECAEGVEHIKTKFDRVQSLRDVSMVMLQECESLLTQTVYRRCKYVIEENERLLTACIALEKKDLRVFGQLMYQTHDGLKDDYQVSCKELDFLVGLVRENQHVYGARMMGGGFGGCTINLVEPGSVERIITTVTTRYAQRFGCEPKAYITSISSGTSLVDVNENARI